MTHKVKHPTYASQVLELLVAADDALRCREIAKQLGLSTRLISGVLHTLYRYRAVDVIEGQDDLWWYATPGDDTRTRVVKEVAEFHKPNVHRTRNGERRKRNERPRRD